LAFFMHQWTYKDPHIREMITKPSDRAEIVRVATEAFGGTLHQFFLAFGDYDGVAISEFPDATTALACMMSVYGQGGLGSLKTTLLIPSDQGKLAMELAQNVLRGAAPPADPTTTA
jgi:uncharacterized protein with GYD domain